LSACAFSIFCILASSSGNRVPTHVSVVRVRSAYVDRNLFVSRIVRLQCEIVKFWIYGGNSMDLWLGLNSSSMGTKRNLAPQNLCWAPCAWRVPASPRGRPAAVAQLVANLPPARSSLWARTPGTRGNYKGQRRRDPASCTIAQYEQICGRPFASARRDRDPERWHRRGVRALAPAADGRVLPAPLHRTSVCLNVGEFNDAGDSLQQLESAVERSFVGNLYLKDPVSARRERKTKLKQIISVNKRKEGYTGRSWPATTRGPYCGSAQRVVQSAAAIDAALRLELAGHAPQPQAETQSNWRGPHLKCRPDTEVAVPQRSLARRSSSSGRRSSESDDVVHIHGAHVSVVCDHDRAPSGSVRLEQNDDVLRTRGQRWSARP
jgi:hypothetical protein